VGRGSSDALPFDVKSLMCGPVANTSVTVPHVRGHLVRGGVGVAGCEASQGQCGHVEAAWPAAVRFGFSGGWREQRRDGAERERIRLKGVVPLLFTGPKP
jgi:hypothetical protein